MTDAGPDADPEDTDDDFERPRPPRQVTPPQALFAVVVLCVLCLVIGFVLGRTL
jgi:4-hydroxybenzoate polyprenyltransferase